MSRVDRLFYKIVWKDNDAEHQPDPSWSEGWLSKHLCSECGILDLNASYDLCFSALSDKGLRDEFNPVSPGGMFVISSALYREIQSSLAGRFRVGDVCISGKMDPSRKVCVAEYHSRIVIRGEDQTEDLGVCADCGRRFSNAIGKKYLAASEVQSHAAYSTVSGASLILHEDIVSKIPQAVSKGFYKIGLPVRS
jgi:hypothetical protein